MTVLQVPVITVQDELRGSVRAAPHSSHQTPGVANVCEWQLAGIARPVSCTEKAGIVATSVGRGQIWRRHYGGLSNGLVEVGEKGSWRSGRTVKVRSAGVRTGRGRPGCTTRTRARACGSGGQLQSYSEGDVHTRRVGMFLPFDSSSLVGRSSAVRASICSTSTRGPAESADGSPARSRKDPMSPHDFPSVSLIARDSPSGRPAGEVLDGLMRGGKLESLTVGASPVALSVIARGGTVGHRYRVDFVSPRRIVFDPERTDFDVPAVLVQADGLVK